MTKCPKCNRTFAEDFAFCLDDGTPLKPNAVNQATLVTPSTEVPPPTLVMPSLDAQPPTLVMAPPETHSPTPAPPTSPANAAATAQPTNPTLKPNTSTASHAGPSTASHARPLTSSPGVPSVTRVPPPTTSGGRPIVAIVIGVFAVFVVVIVLGGVGLWLLSSSQNQNQGQTSNTSQSTTAAPSSAAAANPNPGATVIPLGELKPNSSTTPSTSGDISSSEAVIATGTYQCELTRKMGEGNKVTVALKVVLAVNADGTYLSRGYMTIPTANVHDQLGIEERGNYSQSGDTLRLTNRKERQYDLNTGRWKAWGTPDDGAASNEKVRNVTPNTFQLFDDDEKEWFTFTKT